MKKTLLLLCAIAGLISCTKELVDSPQEPVAGIPMKFEISVAETKAEKTDWAVGDKIYVFFDGLGSKYLILTKDDAGKWDNTSGGSELLDTDFASLTNKKLTAVHFPVDVDVTFASDKFSFTSGGDAVYNYYLFEAGKDYIVDGSTVKATLSMGKPEGMVQIHVAGIQASVADYSFSCPLIMPVACTSVSTDGTITEDVLSTGSLSGVADSDGAIFAGRLATTSSADYVFSLTSECYIYTLTRSDRTLTAGKMYNFPALTETGGTNWSVAPVMVDLGLGTKWAKCNLGASSVGDPGDLYAWGELSAKEAYKWSNYRFFASGTSTANMKLSKYTYTVIDLAEGGTADGKWVLEPEDDAVNVAFGGNYRMPAQVDMENLYNSDKCNWEWITDYNGTGANGYLVTSKIAGYTDNSIFLPAGGFKDGSTLKSTNMGFYWINRLDADNPMLADYLRISKEYGIEKDFAIARSIGLSVRPVSD